MLIRRRVRLAFLLVVSACTSSRAPAVMEPTPVESAAPSTEPSAALEVDADDVHCRITGTDIPVPANATATGDGATEIVFVGSSSALVIKTGRDGDLLRDAVADWAQLLTAVGLQPSAISADLKVQFTLKPGVTRLSAELVDEQATRYRLTSMLVSRNGATCRIQALERAASDAGSSMAASINGVRDLAAIDLDLGVPAPRESDWAQLARLLRGREP